MSASIYSMSWVWKSLPISRQPNMTEIKLEISDFKQLHVVQCCSAKNIQIQAIHNVADSSNNVRLSALSKTLWIFRLLLQWWWQSLLQLPLVWCFLLKFQLLFIPVCPAEYIRCIHTPNIHITTTAIQEGKYVRRFRCTFVKSSPSLTKKLLYFC